MRNLDSYDHQTDDGRNIIYGTEKSDVIGRSKKHQSPDKKQEQLIVETLQSVTQEIEGLRTEIHEFKDGERQNWFPQIMCRLY